MTISDDLFEGSVFGELDIDAVPDDPFFIELNRYNWVVTKAEFLVGKNDPEAISAAVTFAIDNPKSEYHSRTVSQYYRVYPRLTDDWLENLPPDEKAKVKRSLSTFKMMCRGISLSETEIMSLRPSNIANVLVGRRCSANLVESHNKQNEKRPYKNLQNFGEVMEDEDAAEPWESALDPDTAQL